MPVLHMSKGPQLDLARCKWDKSFPASIRTAKKTGKDFEKSTNQLNKTTIKLIDNGY